MLSQWRKTNSKISKTVNEREAINSGGSSACFATWPIQRLTWFAPVLAGQFVGRRCRRSSAVAVEGQKRVYHDVYCLRAVIWSNFILQLNVILVLERSDFTNWEIRIIFNWCDWICEEVVNEQCWIVEIWPKSNSLVNSVITISRNIKGFLNLNRLTESWLKHAIANNERIWKNLPTKLLKRLLLFKAL